MTAEDALDEPIDVGDTFEWTEEAQGLEPGQRGESIEVLSIYVSEDGTTQIRVDDGAEKRTLFVWDIIKKLHSGWIQRSNNE
jgi:hypothetical protein